MNTAAVTDEEKELLLRLQQGDSRAFEALYNYYGGGIASNLLRFLKSEELVEDVMQDLFLKIWNNREIIDPSKSFRAYLSAIAENMVYDVFRKAARDKKLEAHFMGASARFYTHIEENIFNIENGEALRRAIDRLPPQRRQIYTLCKLEEKSYDEVSELLGISHATINDHLTRANRFLRQQLSPASLLSALAAIILYRI